MDSVGSEAFVALEALAMNLTKSAFLPSREENGQAPAAAEVMHLVDQGIFWGLTKLGLDVRPVSISQITGSLPLVASPTPVVLAVASYVVIVVLSATTMKRNGAKPLKKEPRPLKALVLVHNLFLCILSLIMGLGILHQAWYHEYTFWGNQYDNSQTMMGRFIYLFYVSKLYEFVDTFIMLWKRNLRQVTVLHVYHHATITLVWWILGYRAPGGDAYFSAAFNSWVHVFMYAYYFMAAVIGKDERKRKKYLFWGKYLTIAQMVQFSFFMGQAAYLLAFPQQCAYPRPLVWMLFFYSLSLLSFFANFFIQKHIRGTTSKKLGKIVPSERLAPASHIKDE